MTIDASIYGGIRQPEHLNPLMQYAQAMQVQGAQQQNELNGMKMDEYQRGVGEKNRLLGILQGGGDEAALLKGGFLKESTELGKAKSDQAKSNAAAEKDKIEAAHKRADLIGQGLGWLKDNPNIENAQTVIQHFVQSGFMPPDVAQQKMVDFQRDPTPQGIQKLATMGWQGALAAKDQLPKYETQNLGGTSRISAINPVTGKRTTVDEAAITQSQDNAANNATSRANNAATVGATYAGQRQAENHFQAGQNAPQYMETDAGLIALPKKLAPGQAPTGTPVMGADGQPLGKPLKQIPVSANTAIITNTQNLSKAQQALALLQGNSVGEMTGDKNATGWKGMAPGPILNRMDPKGVDTRAAIADLGSMVLHDRSGAAVTASEYPRLQPFIPTATDDAATAAKKLKRFIQVYEQENQALQQTYGKEQGYRPSTVKPTGGTTAPAASEPNIDALIKKYAK